MLTGITILIGFLTACSGNHDKPAGAMKTDGSENADSAIGTAGLTDSPAAQYPVIKDGTAWPEDLPASIPSLEPYGKIIRYRQTLIEGSTTFEMYLEGFSTDDFSKYETQLQKNGFRTKKNMDGKQSILAAEKDKNVVNIRMGEEGISQVNVIIWN